MRTHILSAAMLLSLAACQSVATGASGWSPDAAPSVMNPPANTAENGWAAYRTMRATPSVDEQLDDPILRGAVDIHAHFGPDTYNRQWDAFEIVRRAQAHGMRAVVLKSHWTETATLAQLAHIYAAPDLEVFGGLALNSTVGGINPMAVRLFAEVEGRRAKVVWMPTHDSEHEVTYQHQQRPFVRVSRDGVLLPQVLEVLDLIARYDLTLATGHVRPEEMLMIVEAAQARGVRRIIITHPGLGPMFTDPTPAQLQEVLRPGIFVEVVANELYGAQLRAEIVAMMRTVGPAHLIVSTDSGLTGTPNHTDALVRSARILREEGFSESDLDLMYRRNPAAVLGLTPQ